MALADLRVQSATHLCALDILILFAPDDDLTELEERAWLATSREVECAYVISETTSIILSTPGRFRDELIRRLAANPDALNIDPYLAFRIWVEFTKAEMAVTHPEVSHRRAR
jgi:hypothetical protein